MIDLLPGEKVIVGIRKHWLIFVVEIAGLIIAGLVPLILAPWSDVVLKPLFPAWSAAQLANLTTFFMAGWLLLLFFIFFVLLTTYYLDILIVTSERLIDVEQLSLFSRNVAVAPLANIEDVKVEVLGIFATLLRFGNIQIQTAAETKEILMKGIRHPEYARNVILQAYHEAIQREGHRR